MKSLHFQHVASSHVLDDLFSRSVPLLLVLLFTAFGGIGGYVFGCFLELLPVLTGAEQDAMPVRLLAVIGGVVGFVLGCILVFSGEDSKR